MITDQGVHGRAQQKSWTGRGRHAHPGSGARACHLPETCILASPGEVWGYGGHPFGSCSLRTHPGRAGGEHPGNCAAEPVSSWILRPVPHPSSRLPVLVWFVQTAGLNHLLHGLECHLSVPGLGVLLSPVTSSPLGLTLGSACSALGRAALREMRALKSLWSWKWSSRRGNVHIEGCPFLPTDSPSPAPCCLVRLPRRVLCVIRIAGE